MSYDVYLYDGTEETHCSHCGSVRESPGCVFSRNHTSNTSDIWRTAGCDLAAFDGKRASALLPKLDCAIAAISTNPEEYRRLEPSNKWGTVQTTLAFLRAIRRACEDYPNAKVRVSH